MSTPLSATTLRGRRLLLARAAWALIAALTFGVFVAAIPGYIFSVLEFSQGGWMDAPVEGPTTLVFSLSLLGVLASVTTALVCLILAVVLFWRRSNDWMVVLTSSYLLLYGTIMAGPLEWAEEFYAVWPSLAVAVIQPLLLTTPTVALVVLFPDGRFVPRWTRWLIPFSIASVAANLYLPLAFWGVLMVMIICLALYAQVYRYRYVSTPSERQQTKWVTFGFTSWWLIMLLLFVPYSLSLSLPSDDALPWWTLVSSTGWWLSLTIVPLSLSVAVLRYRLYDIDVVINRTLVYGSLTVMLALVYFGSVASLQYAFRAITGHDVFPQLTIVISTLAIAALFDPLRRRVQSFIDRRFYRSKYDARETLDAFSARLRDETDLVTVSEELVSAVRETMQPEHVSLWLRPDTASRKRPMD